MIRDVLGVIWGFVAWFVVATLGNFVVRATVPGYVAVETAMTFTWAMLLARLLLSFVSSLAAGAAVATIAGTPRRAMTASRVLGLFFVALFIPRHYQIWSSFPVWYHLMFLISLFPLIVIGAKETAERLEKRRQLGSVPRITTP